jgi:hypothetical protein
MENYPNIQRREGTLFFACPEFDKGAIATSIERLINMLDAMEEDSDLEPYLAGYAGEGFDDDREADLDVEEGDDKPDDEPTLGARESFEHGNWYSLTAEADLELDKADYEDGGDDEPLLAAAERHPNIFSPHGRDLDTSQERWNDGESDGREADGDDREPDESGIADEEALAEMSGYEPSLGWTNALNQSGADRFGDGTYDTDLELDRSEYEADGDEEDFSDDDGVNIGQYGGTGDRIARDLIRGMPIATRRAAAYAAIGGRA